MASTVSENDKAWTVAAPVKVCAPPASLVTVSVVPPSFEPAVNVNGMRKSVMPGSGLAPMRFSSLMM